MEIETPELPVFTAENAFPYDLKFSRLAQDWATGCAALGGADAREQERLKLALDETLAFLIGAYPDAEPLERIGMEAALMPDGLLSIVISNAGPPLHPSRIPAYDPQSPAAADGEGLWYFLAKDAVDELRFDNLGMKGWRVTVSLRLATQRYAPATPVGAEADDEAGSIKFTCRPARPEDASDIVDLTYGTYRYSYASDVYYHPERLAEAIEKESIAALVVETDGRIVGNSTIYSPPQGSRCADIGGLMVHKDFRRSRAIMYLMRETARFMEANTMGVDMYTAVLVTAHGGSQKAAKKQGCLPLGIYLGTGIQQDYQGIKTVKPKRESYVFCARLARPLGFSTLFVPERHHQSVRPLLEQFDFSGELSGQEVAPQGTSVFHEHLVHIHQSAFLVVESFGADWAEDLRKALFDLHAQGMRSVIVRISAHAPLPKGLDEVMMRNNALFCGFMPRSAEHFDLTYCVLAERIDFDAIVLIDPLAQAFAEHQKLLHAECLDA